jgi:hypothetical protein
MSSQPSRPVVHPAALPIDELACYWDVVWTRRGGPGGQHRNKVETAVVITHRPTGIVGQASERRSRDQNHRVAVHRLRVQLALAVRAAVNGDQRPSPLWLSRCRRQKISVSAENDDFPPLLAEALDRLAASRWDVSRAADQLGVTATQLVRFLKLEPRALGLLNDARRELGLRPLK